MKKGPLRIKNNNYYSAFYSVILYGKVNQIPFHMIVINPHVAQKTALQGEKWRVKL